MESKASKDVVYAFIDSQNLNLGTSKDIYRGGMLIYEGWKLDMKAFRKYLRDYFRVTKAYLFIGYIKTNESMYKSFQSFGYEIIFKPTVKDSYGKPKGNVDAEIVLYASRLLYDYYDKAVFTSGDGDFACLYKFLNEVHKLKALIIPNRYTESSLLKSYGRYKAFLEMGKNKLGYIK